MISDIIFVYINVLNGKVTGAEYQLNSAYIRSYLQKRDIKTHQYINHKPSSHWEIIKDLNNSNSEKIAFYINEYNYYISKVIINKLKILNKKITILAFGPLAGHLASKNNDDCSIDIYLVKHEFRAIEEILSGKNIWEVENIAYYCGNKVLYNKASNKNYSLDDLGLIYSHGLVPPQEVRSIGMLSSVGCYGDCTFCSYIEKNVFKVHSYDAIEQELDYLKFYIGGNQTQICFFDDCFSVSTNRSLELCEMIKAKKYDFQYWCCTRTDLLTNDLIDLMADCNFKNIVIGLETASPEVLSKTNKSCGDFTSEQYLKKTREIYHYALKKGINPYLSFIFGLPHEQLSDANKTTQFISDNSAVKNISISYMTCFPGSRIFENSEAYGITKEPSPTQFPYRTYYTNYDMRIVNDNLYKIGAYNNETNNIVSERKMFINYFSGIFHEPEITNRIKYIKIPSDINPKQLEFIDKHLSLEGTLMIQADRLELSTKYLYSDDRKRLKLSLKSYDALLSTANKYNGFIPKISFIKQGNLTMIQPDDVYRKEPILINNKKIINAETLKELEGKVKDFIDADTLTSDDLLNWTFENGCMLSGDCSLCALQRVEIEGEEVYSCFYRLKIGTINDTYSDLLNNCYLQIYEVNSRRDCMNCKAKSWCSKCIAFSDTLCSDSYCNWVKANPYIPFYINITNFMAPYISGIHKITMRVFVAEKYNKMLNQNERGITFHDKVMLVNYENTYLLFRYDINGVINCNKKEWSYALSILGINKEGIGNAAEYNRFIYKLKTNKFLYTETNMDYI